MRCFLLWKLWKTYDNIYLFEYCPSCGVHAPWANPCKEEEE